MSEFLRAFCANRPQESKKWSTYFEVYERHLARYINQAPIIFEIGVANGGSLHTWSEIFGASSSIIGIDTNSESMKHADQSKNIFVECGDGRDVQNLNLYVQKYGRPDIVIDDGDHRSPSMKSSLEALWPHLSNNGTYLIEDVHGVFWQPSERWDTSIFDKMSEEIYGLNHFGSRGNALPTNISKDLFARSSYWSIFVLEKREKIEPPYCLSSKNGMINKISEAI